MKKSVSFISLVLGFNLSNTQQVTPVKGTNVATSKPVKV